jgi:hypothetical protein
MSASNAIDFSDYVSDPAAYDQAEVKADQFDEFYAPTDSFFAQEVREHLASLGLVFRYAENWHIPRGVKPTLTRFSFEKMAEVPATESDYNCEPSDEKRAQYYTWSASEFTSVTATTSVNCGADPMAGTALLAPSANYCDFDPLTLTLVESKSPAPIPNIKVGNTQGDLVCGVLALDKFGKPTNTYAKWFIASQQMLHAVRLMRFQVHDAFKGKTEEQLRGEYMRGNKLATNAFGRWAFSVAARQVETTDYVNGIKTMKVASLTKEEWTAEARKRMWVLRHETATRQYYHIWAAWVLMVRWGEMPNYHNYPMCYQNLKRSADPRPVATMKQINWFAKTELSKYHVVGDKTQLAISLFDAGGNNVDEERRVDFDPANIAGWHLPPGWIYAAESEDVLYDADPLAEAKVGSIEQTFGTPCV